MIGGEEHPIKTEESANQSEGCDAKLEGPERAASCTFCDTQSRASYQSDGRYGAFCFGWVQSIGVIFVKEEILMKPRQLVSLLIAVCMMVAILPLSAFAADNATTGTCGDNVNWALTEDNNGDYTLTISGKGAMTDYSANGQSPWFWANKQIRRIVIEDGVTTVGAYAFQGCDRFYTIALPASVVSIGDSAFRSCTSLETIDLSNADNLQSIGNDAFHYCYNFTDIVIPDSVKVIGENAFFDCHALKNVTISTSSKMTTISKGAFGYCAALKNITIPAGVTEIGNSAFVYGISLETITFAPNSKLTTVGNKVFNTCYAKIYCEPALAGVLSGKTGDASIVSQVTVKINYNGLGGENTETTATYPAQIKEPATPSAEGYTFLGWYDENGDEFDFGTPVTKDTAITAKWVKDHQLTVKGGTFTVDDKVVEENPADVPEGAKVVVTFDESTLSDAQTFDQWTISSSEILNAINPNNKTIEFTMPEEGVTVEAMTKDISIEDDGSNVLGTAAVIGTVAVGGAVIAWQGYNIAADIYARDILPEGTAIPETKEALAVMLWQNAGKPEVVAADGTTLSETEQAQQWVVANGLMENEEDGTFHPEKGVGKFAALNAIKEQQETANAQ